MVAFLFRRERDGTRARLAFRLSVRRHFYAVIHGVADKVNQRIGQGLYEVLVEVGFFAAHGEIDFFFQTAGKVPDHARETTKHLLDRLHARLHHRRLQIARDHIQAGYGFMDPLVFDFVAQALEPVSD